MLQESLDTEKAPLSMKELQTNIEQVRSLIDKKRGQLEVREWDILKKHLRKGFRLDHLKRYVALKKPRILEKEQHVMLKKSKPDTIKYVVEEIWGFTVPQLDKTVVNKNKTRLSLNIKDGAILDYLLTNDRQPLKRMSQELNVQIDVYRFESRICVTGITTKAQEAVKRISYLSKKVQVIVVPLTGALGAAYHDRALQPYIQPFLRSIQQKFQVHTAVTPDSISIVHLNQPRLAQQAHREIQLAAAERVDRHVVGIWPPTDGKSVVPLLAAPTEFSTGLYQLPWFRAMASSQQNLGSSSIGEHDFTKALQDIETWMKSIPPLPEPAKRDILHHDMVAKFGQALFMDPKQLKEPEAPPKSANPKALSVADNTDDGPIQSSSNPPTVVQVAERSDSARAKMMPSLERPRIVGDIPYVPQQIALLKPWVSRDSQPPTDPDPNAKATLRVELRPATEVSEWPKFEIFATQGKTPKGRKPSLTVARISAIYNEQEYTILCPEYQTDVRLCHRLKRDLLARKVKKEDEVFLTLLNGIKGFLGRASGDKATEWVFSPFVSLPMQDSLKWPNQTIEMQSKGDDEDSALQRYRRDQELVEYILSAVEVVDVDSRAVSLGVIEDSKLQYNIRYSLDHVTLTGPDVTRQELRLARQPMLYAPKLTRLGGRNFIQSALKVAEQLGRDPTTLSGRIRDIEITKDEEGGPTGSKRAKVRQAPASKPLQSRAWKKKN